MITLVMDSSTPFLYILLLKNEQILWQYLEKGNNDHSEKLSNLIKQMLEKTHISVDEIDEIVVGIGPGSYTGVRVSMTIAKVWAWSKKIPLYTFGSLDMLASTFIEKDGIYITKLDAKRGNSFVKVMKVQQNKISIEMKDSFMSHHEIEEVIQKKYPDAIVIDQIDESYFDYVKMKKLGMIHKVEDVYSLVPNYVRSGL